MNKAMAVILLHVLFSGSVFAAEVNQFIRIEGGDFRSVIPVDESNNLATVSDFYLQQSPVTNAEFLRFVLYRPEWQRERAPGIFADDQYLSAWAGPISLGQDALPDQPVTRVSWFAANAYCKSENGRLPTWYEWEFVAAANEKRSDARDSDAWQRQIISWYSTVGGGPLSSVRARPANYHNVYDAHGLVWEWVDDFTGLLVSGDNREQGGADQLQFCGAGAITMEEKENYAVLMRVAMLSSLEARFTTRNLGFRCARSMEPNQ
ncbi:MAG: formylglycine-generating enzyme family protein [Woeseia sp.]|jgi:formylglycine-generating enzyme|nr:formylglycine-generating enzyme family protein [Woeseia sp.]